MNLVLTSLFGSHATPGNQPFKLQARDCRWPDPAFDEERLQNKKLKLVAILSLSCNRYVALRFVLAELTGRNREIKVHRHGAMSDGEPAVIRQTIKSLVYQAALGASFLRGCGVIHVGR